MPFSKMTVTKVSKDRTGEQLRLDYRRDKNGEKRGGKREGAGRKPGKKPLVRHRTRATFRRGSPIHVTLRVRREAAGLRRRKQYQAIRAAMRRTGHKADFRICHYSIQGNHFHLICEALDRRVLARGVQGFTSLVARRLNQLMGRRGRFFADRYHCRALQTPREVRNALCYVLNNWRRHGEHEDHPRWDLDPYSSADLFDGWKGWHGERHRDGRLPPAWLDRDEPIPIPEPTYWLLTDGWRRRGLLSPTETPGPQVTPSGRSASRATR